MNLVPSFRPLCLVVAFVGLAACEAIPAPPDYRIKVMPSEDGIRSVAVPPECPDWSVSSPSPFDNQYSQRYGCAAASNLAAQVAVPDDLLEGDSLSHADATRAAAGIRDYRAGKTAPLIDAKKDAPAARTPTGSGATP